MSFKEDLRNKEFMVTAELNPPKSFECDQVLANAAKLKGLVSAINITDNSAATVKISPMIISHLIKRDYDIEPIWQITCRDRNRLAIQSDLLAAKILGLENILPLRGDEPKFGDYPETKASFDLNTDELVSVIKGLEQGQDLAAKPLKPHSGDFTFCVGSAAHPNNPDLLQQKETMLRRIDLGVEFFQTQICFDIQQIKKFREIIGEDLARKTLLGLTPLKSLKQAEFMHENIWGVEVPLFIFDELNSIIASSSDNPEVLALKQRDLGLKFASELYQEIKNLGFKGVHVMAIGQESSLAEIINTVSQPRAKNRSNYGV